MVEGTGVATLFAVGMLLLYSAGLRSAGGFAALSLPTGAAAHVTTGLFLAALGLEINPWSTLGMVAAMAALTCIVGRQSAKGPPVRLARATTIGAGVVGIVLIVASGFEAVNIANFTPDSFRYITTASLLERNGDLGVAPGYLLEDRGFSLPYLHSLAQNGGPDYLASLGPGMALSGLGILLWIGHGFFSRVRGRSIVRWGLLGAVTLSIFTTNRFVFHAFYINGHMVFGVWLLLIAVACLVLARRDSPSIENPLFLAAALATPSIVALRLEGGAVVGLMLIATTVVTEGDRRPAYLLIVLGSAAAIWYGLIVPAGYEAADNDTTISTISIAVGGGAAALLGIGCCIFTRPWPRRTLLVLHSGFWVVLIFLALRDAEPLISGVQSTIGNLAGPGLWGVSLPFLFLLAFVILATLRFRGTAIVAFPLLSFFPMAFILSYVGGPTYRVAPGDSLNRMWVHFLLLIGLIVIVAMVDQIPVKSEKLSGSEG